MITTVTKKILQKQNAAATTAGWLIFWTLSNVTVTWKGSNSKQENYTPVKLLGTVCHENSFLAHMYDIAKLDPHGAEHGHLR